MPCRAVKRRPTDAGELRRSDAVTVVAWLRVNRPLRLPERRETPLQRYWRELEEYWGALWFLVSPSQCRRELRLLYGPKRKER